MIVLLNIVNVIMWLLLFAFVYCGYFGGSLAGVERTPRLHCTQYKLCHD